MPHQCTLEWVRQDLYILLIEFIQQAVFADYNGLLRFAANPREAPIIHFGGPLQISLTHPQRLQIGRSVDVILGVGSPGVGAGTMAYVFYDGVIPQSAYPKLEVTYPPVKPGEAPLKDRELLTEEKFRQLQQEFPGRFVAMMGAEAIKELLKRVEIDTLSVELRARMKSLTKS